MLIRQAKILIEKAMSETYGFKALMPDEFHYMALGVKIGSITPEKAAAKIKELCTVKTYGNQI